MTDVSEKANGGPRIELLRETPINTDETLRQLLGPFQQVRAGLPELVKNAKDHYARLGIADRADRPIVVIVDTKKSALAVVDFGGADRAAFERWKTWSNPDASQASTSSDIEGGHGNGGKGFMVCGTTDHSFMLSVFKGRRTKMGFQTKNKAKLYSPGYYIDDKVGKLDDVPETGVRARLDEALAHFGLKFADLPQLARGAFDKRQAFTIVQINGVRDWQNNRRATVQDRARSIAAELQKHPQASLSLDSCSVWVIVDRTRHDDSPLETERLAPRDGFDSLPPLHVPQKLKDPVTGDDVDTGPGASSSKVLQLRTSKLHLRANNNRAFNTIRVRSDRNVVASLAIADLVPQNESAYIYGELRVPALKAEHLVGADRNRLNDTPLARALEQWTIKQVEDLATRIQKAEAKDHKPQDRDKANEGLRRFRELMRRYLDPEGDFGDEGGDGRGTLGDGEDGIHPPPPPPGPRGTTVQLVELEPGRERIVMAAGTSVPLVVRCYELASDGKRLPVRNVSLDLRHTPGIELKLDASRRLVCDKPGKAEVWVADSVTGIESNRRQVEVVACTGVDVLAPGRTILLQGERLNVQASFHTAQGAREDILIDGTVDETGMATFSRTGVLVTGRVEGDLTLRVRFGARPSDFSLLKLAVGPGIYRPNRRGGQDGGDVPHILLCNTPAPGMDEFPPEQRTHGGGEHEPTIIMDDPIFENVVWINPDSKEAGRVRRGRGGRKSAAGIATATFTQFIALKCFDVLKFLKVRQTVGAETKTELEFRTMLGDAERQCADFVDAAYALADELRAARSAEEAEE